MASMFPDARPLETPFHLQIRTDLLSILGVQGPQHRESDHEATERIRREVRHEQTVRELIRALSFVLGLRQLRDEPLDKKQLAAVKRFETALARCSQAATTLGSGLLEKYFCAGEDSAFPTVDLLRKWGETAARIRAETELPRHGGAPFEWEAHYLAERIAAAGVVVSTSPKSPFILMLKSLLDGLEIRRPTPYSCAKAMQRGGKGRTAPK